LHIVSCFLDAMGIDRKISPAMDFSQKNTTALKKNGNRTLLHSEAERMDDTPTWLNTPTQQKKLQ